jgi:hypothetical protein
MNLRKISSVMVDLDRLLLVEPEEYPTQGIKGCRLHFTDGQSFFVADSEVLAVAETQNAIGVLGNRSVGTT